MDTQKILEVTAVEAHLDKTHPPTLHVTATGNASSGSQQNPRLERREYVEFPADGIQEYDFLIDGSAGPGTDDIKSHEVEDFWQNPPAELKGARVYAQTNSKEDAI
ncbi:MAG: hypothetical protein EOO06_08815 [Chitinophagaceae bacterium]|nr:MAG: hypothetical protein EOO06_08815 [Chitinophagaceae bacterium]